MGTNDFPAPEADPDSTSPATPASPVPQGQSEASEADRSGTSTGPQSQAWSAPQQPPQAVPARKEAEKPVSQPPSTPPDPLIASTIEIPAQGPSDEGGGEWDLLVGKIRTWLNSDDPTALWSRLQLPLKVVGGLIVFLLVSRIYKGILGTIDSLPLAPGLLELAGLIWVLNFALKNLVRSGDRKQFTEAIGTAWARVTGR